MHNPPHPGEVLVEYLGDLALMDAAARVGAGPVTLNNVLTCSSSVSTDLAQRLAQALGTSPDLWLGMQRQYDLHQVPHKP